MNLRQRTIDQAYAVLTAERAGSPRHELWRRRLYMLCYGASWRTMALTTRTGQGTPLHRPVTNLVANGGKTSDNGGNGVPPPFTPKLSVL